MNIYVVVPCFNEIRTIKKLIESLINIKLNLKIILIDDGSTDGTKQLIIKHLKKKIYKFINLKNNFGKGYAINCSKKYIKKNSYVIIQDADLEYDPKDYYKLYNCYRKNNKIDIIYGSRFLSKSFSEIYLSFGKSLIRIFGNKLLTNLSNLINKQKLTDAHTCYKTFNSNIFKNIDLKEKGFSFCPEVNTKISNKNLIIKEVPIKYFSRTKQMGKKISYIDAFYAIKTIIVYKYFD